MTILVRNEEDILATNLDYHLQQGVDFFIVTDNRSEDRTPAILRSYEEAGVVRVLNEPADDYAQSRWVTRMARLAATDHGAEWVLNSDADEFWWPETGNLKDALRSVPEQANVVVAPRHNFVPVEQEQGPFYERMIVRERVSLSPVGAPLPPKVGHRATADIVVEQGNHQVSGVPVRKAPTKPIEILHFPMRSYAQFENKIRLGGRAYERNTTLPPEVGRTWRVLYEEYLKGNLRDRYLQDVLTEQQLLDPLADGELLEDTRLRDFLRANVAERRASAD